MGLESSLQSLARSFVAILAANLFLLLSPQVGLAQKWATEMFEATQHNFGNVPRGAKSEFYFKLKNTYKENVHIAAARSSCACTKPKILKADLKTYEEGAIIAELDTSAFVGQRSAVVTVVFDRPFYAEVQLTVRGNIRSDIVMEPGEVQFGDVPLGESKTSDVKISYQGQGNARDWRITDVRSTNQNLAVKLDPTLESNGRTTYSMSVRLKETAPAGEFHDEIQIITSESLYNQVTLPVRAAVMPPLSITPQSVELGSVPPGSTVKGRMVVRSKKPFSISKIDFGDPRFEAQLPEGEKAAHLVNFEFKAGETQGAFRQRVVITTSLADSPTTDALISGNVAR